jgi:TonB-dependent receptor
MVLFVGVAGAAWAQSTGIITGRVLNLGTKAYLNHAEVRLAGGSIVAYTDESGGFELRNVPAGPARIDVSFPQLDPTTVTVEVPAGQSVFREIGLSSRDYGADAIKLDKFVVAGEKEGKAASIAQQRAAENLMNVISSDEFPNVAGGSIGDFLRNVPGISIDYSVADPRSIRVRGMDPNMNAITVNGMRSANAASGNTNRTFEIDQISLQDVETIEVYKSTTPAMDADSGGGSVNLVSKSAFKLKGRRFNYSLNLFANSMDFGLKQKVGPEDTPSRRLSPGGTVYYSEAFLHNTLGVAVTANWNEFYTPQPSSQVNWLLAAANGLTGTPLTSAQAAFPRQFIYSASPIFTNRKSLSVNLDYKLSESTALWSYNQVNTSEIWGGSRGLDVNENTNPAATSPTTNGPAAGWSISSMTALGDGTLTPAQAATSTSNTFAHVGGEYLDKVGTGTTFGFGTKTRTGPWRIDTSASASLSTNHYRNHGWMPIPQVDLYLRGISYRFDNPNGTNYPTVTQLAGPDIYDLANYVSKVGTGATSTVSGTGTTTNGKVYPKVLVDNPQNYPLQVRNGRRSAGKDVFNTVKADIRRDFDNRYVSYVQVGGSYRRQVRDLDKNGQARWIFNGTTDQLTSLLNSIKTTDFTPTFGPYRQPPYYNLEKLNDYFKNNRNMFNEDVAFRLDTEGNNLKHIEEAVSAGYLMSGVNVTPRLSLLLGGRYEVTDGRGRGPAADNNAARDAAEADLAAYVTAGGNANNFRADNARLTRIRYAKTVSAQQHFGDLFPNAQAKFAVTPNLLVRAAYTETIGRQNFAWIIPGYTVSSSSSTVDQVITLNNPNLKPVYYRNYDASVEYYMKNGVFTVGYFYKAIKNYTAQSTALLDPTFDYGYEFSGYDPSRTNVTTLFNAGKAAMRGVEVKYTQRLGGIWSPLRDFTASAGYTYENGYANATYGGSSAVSAKLPIQNMIPVLVNGTLTYNHGPVTLGAVYNWRGTYANGITSTASIPDPFIRYTQGRGTLDLSGSYRFYKNHSFFIDAKNVTNAQRRDFVMTRTLMRSYNIDGAWIYFGVKGSF